MSESREWRTAHRAYRLEDNIFTKRELRPSELERDMDGRIISLPADSKARLENEYFVLRYLCEHTDIPVPKPLELKSDSGILTLRTSCVADNAIPLSDYAQEDRCAVVESVGQQLQNEIIPALRRHTSHRMGGMDEGETLLLPPRVAEYSDRDWPRFTSENSIFVLAHNDLGQANIFIDPMTHKIVAIVDWEYAGYYPPEFEAQLWEYHPREQDWDAHGSDQLHHLLENMLSDRL